MITPTASLQNGEPNVHSQTGEDNVIESTLQKLPERDLWCVEFGAWDGLYLTNTRRLIESQGYSAVLIEANRQRFMDLQNNYVNRPNVITLNTLVGFSKDDSLDCILSATPVPYNFDLLSVDIDGNDYHVWKAISTYQPKVIVIEFNPTIPTHLRFVQKADPCVNQGASLLSLVELGKEKGYELVAVLPFNAFFVRKKYYKHFDLQSNAPEVLRTNTDAITYLFSGYDGSVFLHGNCKLPWHGIHLYESRMQHLPRVLRKYPENYTRAEKILFAAFLMMREPSRFVKEIKNRLYRRI